MGALVRGSDLVATVPERLGAAMSEDLVLRPCPFAGAFDLMVIWSARTNASAMHRWLRNLILKTCSEPSRAAVSP